MMAIIGMFFQDGLTGSAWGDWAAYTDSPLRAFESELGVQAPVGFWDPLGFAAEGSAADFRRRRVTEIKHGRVSMIACIGYIVPEYFKFPGYLAPHLKLEFSDIPNGLAALSKVPSAGWAQIFFFCGLVEIGVFADDPSRAPGDFERGGVLGVPNGSGPMQDEEARKRKLSAEIANGRLAMVSIIGMFFQDGLTGSAWGDWALYTASPLRAAEDAPPPPPPFDPATQIGAMAPLGFFDPAGFSKVGLSFLRMRRPCIAGAVERRVADRSNAADLQKQWFYRFLEKTYPIHIAASFVALYAFGGLPALVWGGALRTVWVYHVTWLVNSAAHVWGNQQYDAGDLSRNNWWVGILAFGEGWHNNHHAFEFSARHGLEWYQFDVTWMVIRTLQFFGLADKVKLPTDAQKRRLAVV